jgi:hypothetical protein
VTHILSQKDAGMSTLLMTEEELLELPVSVPLVTAARAFGLGRTKAHQLARSGSFPCEVKVVGNRYKVTRAALFEALGVKPPAGSDASDNASSAA